MIEKISLASRLGMLLQIIVGIGLPIFLLWYGTKKLKVKAFTFYAGACVYLGAVYVLEAALNKFVVGGLGEMLTGNVVMYALYGGIIAGLFEEFARALAFRFALNDRLNAQNAIVYGFGHGGIEAMLLIGFNGIDTYITSTMLNNGLFETTLANLDEVQRAESIAAVSALWTTSPFMFFAGAIERIFIIILHIGLSVIVYKSIKANRKELLGQAVFIHFLVDFSALLLTSLIPVLVTELIVAAMSLATAYYAYILCRDEIDALGIFNKTKVVKEASDNEGEA